MAAVSWRSVSGLQWRIALALVPVALAVGELVGALLFIPLHLVARASVRAAGVLAPVVLRLARYDVGLPELVRAFVREAASDHFAEERTVRIETAILEGIRDRAARHQLAARTSLATAPTSTPPREGLDPEKTTNE